MESDSSTLSPTLIREQKKKIQAIAKLISWDNATLYYMLDVPQVKRDLTSSTINFVYELLHESPNDNKIPKFVGRRAWCLVSVPEIRPLS